jgi:hypothetical protein
MNECKRTLSGKHHPETTDTFKDLNKNYITFPICKFCGMIIDTEIPDLIYEKQD